MAKRKTKWENRILGQDVSKRKSRDTQKERGLVEAHFSLRGDTHRVYDSFDASIKSHKGEVVFEQEGVKFPPHFSQQAVNIVSSKYFYGDTKNGNGSPKEGKREYSFEQLIERVSGAITEYGVLDGYMSKKEGELFREELLFLLYHQYGSFNSPVWFNVGLNTAYGIKDSSGSLETYRYDPAQGKSIPVDSYVHEQASACFIVKMEDSIEGIWDIMSQSARLFKYGSGVGSDWSRLRSTKDRLSNGGVPSGPLSFMEVQDTTAKTIKSGGKSRRAAIMQTLHDWHPDLMSFIKVKYLEEQKAWALIDQGYDGSFNGEAYGSVAFQNVNMSVRVTDQFMRMASKGDHGPYELKSPQTQEVLSMVNPMEALLEISKGTHICGDPGLQFDGMIQRYHTCPNTDRIWSSNPCSEFLFLDDTACNLASLNLLKFYEDGKFRIEDYVRASNIFLLAMDILVGRSSYPSPEIAENSYKFRPLGLGFANLGALLMSMGLGYDSDEGRSWAGALMALEHMSALHMSAQIASVMGPFEGYEENKDPYQAVLSRHQENIGLMMSHGKVEGPGWDNKIASIPKKGTELMNLWTYASKVGKMAISETRRFGARNSQVTVLAPTGTISFMMDCDTTGIEPELGLVKYKLLAGKGEGMIKMVNQRVKDALLSLGYADFGGEIENILGHIEKTGTIEGADILAEHLPVFDCSFKPENGTRTLSHMAHLKMMGACQPFVSGAISKTVNLPEDATIEDISQTYVWAWYLGLKAVAVYRDNSKRSQPLSTSSSKDEDPVSAETRGISASMDDELVDMTPQRDRLPDLRPSLTHKFSIAGHEGYVHVGMYPEGHDRVGEPGEVFITMSKQGSTISGLMDAFATSISICLQHRVPLDLLIRKFQNSRYEPSGFTQNPDVPMAKSLTDYIFQWLDQQFNMDEYDPESPIMTTTSSPVPISVVSGKIAPMPEMTGQFCDTCGSPTVQSGSCQSCPNCGGTSGCG